MSAPRQSIFTRLLLIVIILSFCLWGIGDIFMQGDKAGAVAQVGKVSISQREYQQAVRNRQEFMREKLGKAYTPELAAKLGAEKQALEALINRYVLEQEAAAMGFIAGEEDIVTFIGNNPDFHDEKGVFSKDIYIAALRSNNLSEQAYITSLRSQIATKLLLSVIVSGMAPADDLVSAYYRTRFERRTAELLLIPANAAAATEPSEKDIKAYYDANSAKYMVPEYRALSYVELKEEEVAKTITLSEAEIQKAYDDRKDEFKLPERRAVEQMLFEKQETAVKASAELASGKAFKDVAASLPVLNKNKLALGELTKSSVPVAADEVFALKEGEATKPAQSGFGWHVLQVTKIIPEGQRPLAEVRELIIKEITGKAASDAIYKLARNFEDTMAGGMSLEDAAKKFGYNVQTLPLISRDGITLDGSKQTFPTYPNFMEVAFATAAKDHSRMAQADNGVYFMVQVNDVKASHPRPFDEVKAQAAESVKKEQAGKQLQELTEQISKDLKAGKSLADALKSSKAVVPALEKSGALLRTTDSVPEGKLANKPLPPQLVMDLFKTKPGSFTSAHALPDGSYMIAKLDQVIPAPDISAQGKDAAPLKAIREELSRSWDNQVQSSYIQYLRTKYPVVIHNQALTTTSADYE